MEPDPTRASVLRTYERIAGHFADTRSTGWPEVGDFLDGRVGRRGCDLGCGNGRHLPVLSDTVAEVVAVDFSRALLTRGRELDLSGVEWCQADIVALPFTTETFDVGLCIATVHHLPSREERVTALDEFARVLRSDGVGLLSVWSVTADRFEGTHARDATVPWTLPSGETVERFYHLYDRDAIEVELAASNLVVEELRESSGNWYATVRPT